MEQATVSITEKAQGCLLLGAIGDALGAPVEFMSYADILEKYADQSSSTTPVINGIQWLDEAYGTKGAITDDTQMTLFAAESLVTAYRRGEARGILAPYWTYTSKAYKDWFRTQSANSHSENLENAWSSEELLSTITKQGRRSPGNTCLGALQELSEQFPEPAKNNSKGCGTVMRAAPIGIFFGNLIDDISPANLKRVYDEGVADAAITHGHPVAQHASAVLAVIITLLLHDQGIESAINTSLKLCTNNEITNLCRKALDLSVAPPQQANIKELGGGWTGDEALAIAIYCSLYRDRGVLSLEDCLRLAVNHDGDSDSTGAITGNIIGAACGRECFSTPLLADDSEVARLASLIKGYAKDLVIVNR